MSELVQIHENLPDFIAFQGVNYLEIKSLPVRQLALFVERDIFQFVKEFTGLNPHLSIICEKVGAQSNLNVTLGIARVKDKEFIQQEVERILWSYNYQEFTAYEGTLTANPSHFHYQVRIY